MQPIIKSCCGIDVHKKMIKACIAKGPLDKLPKFEIKTFSTITSDLLRLKDRLRQNEVEKVAMESTGVYWKPIFNILEDEFPIVLANPQALRKIPGKKSDVIDCQWIATLLRCNLVPESFIPPRPIRELRDLSRTRRKLVGVMAADKNRLHKVLEDANIKLSSVVSEIDGVSSMNLIQALMTKDELTREEIKALVHGKLRSEIDQLVEALNGKLTNHHRKESHLIQTIPGMLQVFHAGMGFVREIMRVQELKRVEISAKETSSSRRHLWKLPSRLRKRKVLHIAPSTTISLNEEAKGEPWLLSLTKC